MLLKTYFRSCRWPRGTFVTTLGRCSLTLTQQAIAQTGLISVVAVFGFYFLSLVGPSYRARQLATLTIFF